MKYTVTITETLIRNVLIDAESEEEATRLAKDGWLNGDYILDADNFTDVDFAVDENDMRTEMNYSELSELFCKANENGLTTEGYIVFTPDSFDSEYDEAARTYVVSSNNKAYQSGMGGYSIFASCLDGSDPCIRLDCYMCGDGAWKIERCYMMVEEYNRISETLNKENRKGEKQ